jgi:acyl dehydratase
MTAATALGYVPEYVSDDVRARIVALAEESPPEPAPLDVSDYLIRHWCEALEDGNPLYRDPAYARGAGFPGIVAPPASLLTTFLLPLRWPWPPDGREPRRFIHYDLKELLDLPVGIVTDIDVTYYAPVFIGDRLNTTQRLVSISPWKRTRVGEGHFWTIDRTYRNQHAELVARERMTIFSYGRGTRTEDGTARGGWSEAVEEMIGGDGAYQPPEPVSVYWDDVIEGAALPELHMPITFTRAVYLASATRDFSPQHSNRDYAQQRSNTRDVFVNTPFNMGMVSRLLTDWAGPRSTVRRLKVAMRGNVCAGDEMIVTGTVVAKYEAQGEHRVDVDVLIAVADGPATPCSATLALPRRIGNGGARV